MTRIEEKKPPTRLIICVDGTWLNQDGLEGAYQGNPTNIYRVWASIEEGLVEDVNGHIFTQKKKYFSGIGWGQRKLSKLLNGAFGKDCPAQIKDVYEYCCQNLGGDGDELFLFGFSRGAYVVRAVANLIHHMRLLNVAPYTPNFDIAYQNSLDLYRSVRFHAEHQSARIHHHFLTEVSDVKSVPIIKFIGVFDTIKAVDDDNLYSISWTDSIKHFRHAMALNETRAAFAVETCDPPTSHEILNDGSHSLIESWFIGGHSDLGGGNNSDGLALHPLQWILREAREAGLVLGFVQLKYPMDLIDDPLKIVFPKVDGSTDVRERIVIKSQNGIQFRLHDIRSSHKPEVFTSRYRIKLHQPTGANFFFQAKNREPFHEGQLQGYFPESPMGVIIHPSVYLIFDTYPSIYLNAKSWGFRDELERFRDQILLDERTIFWDNAPMETGSNLKAIRILICGNAGVGKSTLLNKIFGITLSEESDRAHGQHDINKVYSSESNPGLLIHDSRGFQAGNADEVNKVQTFLRSRSTTSDITERLHVIWYCTLTTRPRATETADHLFFETMSKCASEVPIVVVGTKLDEYTSMLEGQYFASVRLSVANSRAQMLEQLDQMDTVVQGQTRERQEIIEAEFTAIENAKFIGPVFVSKDDSDSIRRLERMTLECLDNEYVRRLYVSAQICDVDQKIDSAITETLRLYRHSTRTAAVPIAFSGTAGTSVVSFILCKNVLQCFGYNRIQASVLDRMLRNLIWSNMDANSLQVITGTIMTLSEGAMTTGIGTAVGLAGMLIGVMGHLAAIPASARAVLMCACDVILILERAFWYEVEIGPDQIRAAAEEYQHKCGAVHADVKDVVPLTGFIKSFQFSKVRLGIEGVIEKHRFQKPQGKSAVDV